ncbi:asparagine synthase (glutamine-hydrolyzing) [Geomonas oryzae]|uniref:asparagine synthase (glutamine-hydrolyzing) n=1 Tax=Geomonas oryzae TaxID=2364273 RepID=UPI00100ABE87|nr:asparagine synthase (glutamine-hydrolyzing) [Geomonas oryzae]
MCGVAGIIGKSADAELVRKMARTLVRRGPDSDGIWADPGGGAALGHTRLSIIDLSDSGRQPMTTADGRYWIVFNGEIFNYLELRKQLLGLGGCFHSNSDTEVILAAFERWGTASFGLLRGMFAFVLWDREARRAYLVRDRLGIKPLLWAEVPGGLVFGSEIKAVLASGLVEPVMEPLALFDLLATGSVSHPRTMVRGVHSVAPGTFMVLDANGERRVSGYWDAAGAAAKLRPHLSALPYQELVALTRAKLEEACRYHLVSDVPVGSFLSGGIDSTAITALMSRYMAEPVRSFTVGFAETNGLKHELDGARIAADFLGCRHHEIIADGKGFSELFDDFIRTIDQPSYDGVNSYFVSRAAGKEVKVALSGLGGDEIFGGYPHFARFATVENAPAKRFDPLLRLLHRLRPSHYTRLADLRGQSRAARYAGMRRLLCDTRIAGSVTAAMMGSFTKGFVEAAIEPLLDAALDSISQTTLVEFNRYLPDTLLRDVDVVSMGHGLEVRPVMLDHLLVEHALALPPSAKLREGRHKSVLVDAVRDLLPPALLDRPKVGFELPIGDWLRSELRERVRWSLESAAARSLFDREFLRGCLASVDSQANTAILWTVVVTVSWATETGCLPLNEAG